MYSHQHMSFLVCQSGVGVEELLVSVVSWVGISVALVCLASCLTTLCCQGAPWHTDHSTIHCNLWANLLFTELLFLVGASKAQYMVSHGLLTIPTALLQNTELILKEIQCRYILYRSSQADICKVMCFSPGFVLHHCWPAALLAALSV